jgi:hypothetical protein
VGHTLKHLKEIRGTKFLPKTLSVFIMAVNDHRGSLRALLNNDVFTEDPL